MMSPVRRYHIGFLLRSQVKTTRFSATHVVVKVPFTPRVSDQVTWIAHPRLRSAKLHVLGSLVLITTCDSFNTQPQHPSPISPQLFSSVSTHSTRFATATFTTNKRPSSSPQHKTFHSQSYHHKRHASTKEIVVKTGYRAAKRSLPPWSSCRAEEQHLPYGSRRHRRGQLLCL